MITEEDILEKNLPDIIGLWYQSGLEPDLIALEDDERIPQWIEKDNIQCQKQATLL
jgi:hypothetical protein